MKKYLSILIIVLFVPCFVWALDDEEIRDYEQDIVEAYEENVDTTNDYYENEEDQVDQGDNVTDDRYVNEDTSYRVVIEDDANLLSPAEEDLLLEDMKPLTKYGHIAFKSISNNPDYSTSSYADDYYHKIFGTQSGTLFLIDMDLREIYIFSDGDNYDIITSSKAYLITDNIYTKATAELYYDCATEAYKEIYDLLEGRKITEPMRHITNALISITLGFFGTFIFMINKSKIPKASDKQLLEYSNIKFNVGDIEAVKTGTSKRYNPPSSSGGSGSSGGGGGGGSSGGGGGHSF